MAIRTKAAISKDAIREQAEADLVSFIKLVHPMRVLGAVHEELLRWWTRDSALDHQLTLLPRDHGKSAMVAYRCAWEITRNPAVRILYISATATLAEKQLKFIKDILESKQYRSYWPEMVSEKVSLREKWTDTEISIDHPIRASEAIRDPTVFTAGLTTTITGLHFDIAVLDDVVIKENAYTQEGRNKVDSQYSLLSSIESGEGCEWVVGTRYHPNDLYSRLAEMTFEEYNAQGEVIGTNSVYEVFERQVEDRGDGTGEFLWPRQQRYDGKWFGFDISILAKKRAKYLDKVQFRAQYYNDPNDRENGGIPSSNFQYYDRQHLTRSEGKWFIRNQRINVFAAIDFAYSLKKRADYTSIVIIGMDTNNNYYVLDIDRFKADNIKTYFDHILQLHSKWEFRKIRAEVTAAQTVIVNDLKDNYIRPYGLALSVEEFRPTRHIGTKEERMEAILQPRYANLQVWHYKGGNTQTLEEELVMSNPPHDDIKDALASAIETAVAPSNIGNNSSSRLFQMKNQSGVHQRFGGIN